MKPIGFVIREIKIPFTTHFSHALATRKQTSSVLFEIVTDEGIHGYGEGTPREYVTGESVKSTIAVLQRISEKMQRLVLNHTDNVIEIITAWENALKDDLVNAPSAQCAMELALLDTYGKMLDKPVINFFDDLRTPRIFYSGVLSDNSFIETEKILSKLKPFGFKQIKIKVGQNLKTDLKKLAMVRSILGEDIAMRIDANGAWSLPEAVEKIQCYCDNGVSIVEQPIPVTCKNDYPLLLQKINTDVKVIIDESICTYNDALWFIKNKGADGFNLKISKHGGLINTQAIYRLASASGLVSQLGCHVGETSVLTAAGMIFAGLSEVLLAYEGAYGNLLLSYDVVDYPLHLGLRGAYDLADVNALTGLGVQINPTLLSEASVNSYRYLCRSPGWFLQG